METEGRSLMSDVEKEGELQTIEVTLAPHEADLAKQENRRKELELRNKIDQLTEKIEKMNAEKEKLLIELEKVSCVNTAQKVRNQSMIITRTYDNEKTKMMDVIDEMKKGTQILKYKRFGSAYHQFEITSDNKYLRWYSKNKKTVEKTSILLESIQHLQKGHLYKADAGASQHQYAFSITYMASANEPKTLEVMAKDKTDFHVWTKGLEFILSTIRKTKRSGQKYDSKVHFPTKHIAEIEFLNKTKLEQKMSKKENPPKELFEKDFEAAKQKYRELEKQLEIHDGGCGCDETGIDATNLVKARAKELQLEIETMEKHFEQGTKELSWLIYRVAWISTEINALDEKMIVLTNSYNTDDEPMGPIKRLKSFF